MKRIFFVAGESSGDMHGANLIRALRGRMPDCACEGLGGTAMAEAGMALRHDLAGEAIMGFTEVVRRLPAIRRLFRDTVAHLAATRPDALVLIDYPGFNMRLGREARALGIPVIYYIGPQVWAWKKHRVKQLAQFARKMLVILPFEEAIYTAQGMDCTYVGHPLIDRIENSPVTGRLKGGGPVIGLLPGSRAQEIRRLLAPMIGVAKGLREDYPDARFYVPCVSEERERQVRSLAGDFPLECVVGGAYEVLAAARFCLVASGTATLETALFGVPMAILYKTTPLNYWIARSVVKIAHIGLVNILADREVAREFIQHEARPERMLPYARTLMADSPERRQAVADFAEVKQMLGGPGASARAAEAVCAIAEEGSHG